MPTEYEFIEVLGQGEVKLKAKTGATMTQAFVEALVYSLNNGVDVILFNAADAGGWKFSADQVRESLGIPDNR